jgi:uncharacterized protein
MLEADLGQLDRKRRLTIDVEVPADDPMWDGTEWTLDGPLQVRLEAQRAGSDVVMRGLLSGRAVLPCRRCLTPVDTALDEDVTFLFQPGLTAAGEEAYPLPERGTWLDLTEPVREHVVLAVPQFVLCSESCKGFCPHCGINRNSGACECATEDVDERWAALRRLAQE